MTNNGEVVKVDFGQNKPIGSYTSQVEAVIVTDLTESKDCSAQADIAFYRRFARAVERLQTPTDPI